VDAVDAPIRSLQIGVEELPDGFAGVALLVDGVDVFGGSGMIGYDPADVFSAARPLIPTNPARRVGLYRCSCGWGTDNNVTAIIAVEPDNRISWSSFASYNGLFNYPLEDDYEDNYPPNDPDDNYEWIVTLPFGRMTFDAAQYLTEYERARSAWPPEPSHGPMAAM
jgi:hypothetical protein